MSHSVHPRIFLKSKPGIIEVVFRGAAIVLSLAASATAVATIYHSSSSMRGGFRFYSTSHHTAAWIFFLSLLCVFYQVLAILQLCAQMKLLLIRIPMIHFKAMLPMFFIIDLGVTALGAIGYFSGAISLAVYAYHWKIGYMPPMYAHMSHITHLSPDYIREYIVPLVSATSALSFLLLFLCIGMIVYFLIARLCLKCPTHGVSCSSQMLDIPEDQMTLTAHSKHDGGQEESYGYAPVEKIIVSRITY